MLAGGMDKVTLQQLFASRDTSDETPVMSWFAGAHQGRETYLTYYGVSQPSEVTVSVPKGETYIATLIDTWEMTEATVGDAVKRGDVLTIPSKPYQALLLTRTKEGAD